MIMYYDTTFFTNISSANLSSQKMFTFLPITIREYLTHYYKRGFNSEVVVVF